MLGDDSRGHAVLQVGGIAAVDADHHDRVIGPAVRGAVDGQGLRGHVVPPAFVRARRPAVRGKHRVIVADGAPSVWRVPALVTPVIPPAQQMSPPSSCFERRVPAADHTIPSSSSERRAPPRRGRGRRRRPPGCAPRARGRATASRRGVRPSFGVTAGIFSGLAAGLDGFEQPAGVVLGVLHYVRHAVDGAGGDVGAVQDREHAVRVEGARPPRDRVVHLALVRDPPRVVGEPRVIGQIVPSRGAHQPPEDRVSIAADDHVAPVRARIGVGGDDAGQGGARGLAHDARAVVLGDDRFEHVGTPIRRSPRPRPGPRAPPPAPPTASAPMRPRCTSASSTPITACSAARVSPRLRFGRTGGRPGKPLT